MGRIIVFTGKGGVGKTSVAAAHARKSAQMGKNTLLVSVDMAHNLSDLFEMPIGRDITKIREHLDGLEIDPEYEMEHDCKNLMMALERMLPSSDEEQDNAFNMIPGMEELFALMKIEKIYRENTYDVIIVDCAPTGETLSLLKFPELLSWYMERFFPLEKAALRVLQPVSQKLFKLELPDKYAMNDVEKLYSKLLDLQELLKNREVCSIRLVCIPEKMVVEETKRNYMYMNLYNFNVDALFINRVLPEEIENEFFHEWTKIQREYVQELTEVFSNIPIYQAKWYDEELKGIDTIDRFVQDVLVDSNLLQVLSVTPNEIYKKTKQGYELIVTLPFAKKEEIAMHTKENEIILRIGNFKRCIPLPAALRTYEIRSAKMNKNELVIQFEEAC